MVAYVVEGIDAVDIEDGSPLAGMDLMSPYVWCEGGLYRMLVRGVPDPLGATDPTGLIAAATSRDGLTFRVDPYLSIVPGGAPDAADDGGCEDPTVVVGEDGYTIFYTGVDGARAQGSLLAATGRRLDALEKRSVLLRAPPGEGNIKEATLVRCPAGDWRLFYEYAAGGASRIGMAYAQDLGDEWHPMDDPFSVREDGWDTWHLSTGPICAWPGEDPVMFYNGATPDARWRIGWVSFAPDYSRVTGRGIEPLLMPPPARDRSAVDIAFAASTVVEGDGVSLYYSLEDRMLSRARVVRYG
ncbi:glycoside hydrolase family protein [Sphingomonas sp. RS2018]